MSTKLNDLENELERLQTKQKSAQSDFEFWGIQKAIDEVVKEIAKVEKVGWVDKGDDAFASLLMIKVNEDVMQERIRQNKKWGHQRHHAGAWLAIIGEEWGEVCEAAGPYVGLTSNKPTDAQNLYEELMHLAATASAFAEQIREQEEWKKK